MWDADLSGCVCLFPLSCARFDLAVLGWRAPLVKGVLKQEELTLWPALLSPRPFRTAFSG
jgi:hypothetical protein